MDSSTGAEVLRSDDNSETTKVAVGSIGKRKEVDEEQTPPIQPSLKRICDTPSDDSSENSTLVQNAQVDKEQTPTIEPSLKRICATPSDDSSTKSTMLQNAQEVHSDTDSDLDDDLDYERRRAYLKSYEEIIKERAPTGEEWDKYQKQIEASKGFDVGFCYRIHMLLNNNIVPLESETINNKDYQRFMKLAEDKACKLEDLQLVKANQISLGRRVIYYFTFIAKGSSDGVVRCYQSKVTHIYRNPTREDTVHFVWLKDECGQVTAEDIKQREGCGADSLRQLYMEVFCPIEPVSRDELKVLRAKYKDFMKLAVKACNDSGGQKLKDLEVEEAYKQIFGLTTHHYISFKGSLDGECRFYQAKATTTCSESFSDDPVYTVELASQKDPSVRLKDDHGQLIEERIKHRKQNEVRKCFDVDRTTDIKIPGVITPVDPETLKGEDYKHFMEMIIAAAKASKDCVGQGELEDLHIEKANQQSFGRFMHHYLTFTAKSSLDGKCRHYQAKVTCHFVSDSDSESESECECYHKPDLKDRVEFVWLKE